MRLIITRHGQTEENKLGILQGHLPGKLSELGLEQARKLSLRLKEERIDKIYSSDLSRAKDTAEIIAQYHPDAELIITKDIRENDLGELTGKTKEEIGFSTEDLVVGFIESKTGETRERMLDRAKNFFDGLTSCYAEETVLIVGHNGINKAILSAIMGKSPDELGSQNNTSINIFQIGNDGKITVEVFDDSSHLE